MRAAVSRFALGLPAGALCLALLAPAARADDFEITVSAKSGERQVVTKLTREKSPFRRPGFNPKGGSKDPAPQGKPALKDKPVPRERPAPEEKPAPEGREKDASKDPKGKRERPTFKVSRGDLVTVSWNGGSTAKSGKFTNVLVHFFVAREKAAGQEKVPPLDQSVVHEGALTMDFAPKVSASGEFTLRIREPGAYLVRVETINMAGSHGHDHYAALDLVVE